MLQGLVMQHMTTHLMLYEATKMQYNPLDNRLLVLILACCCVIWIFQDSLDVYRCVVGLNGVLLVCITHYLFNLIWELSTVLKLKLFRVKQPNQELLLTK